MYIVRVVNRQNGESTDERTFEYGAWNEIGLWLDEYGYNDSKYRLTIFFTD
jgi:hypothetical protein